LIFFRDRRKRTEECAMSRQLLPGEGEVVALPKPVTPPFVPEAFVMCPLGASADADAVKWLCQQALFRWAFEQAQAVARPSILERDLAASWN
jgi:hypothetical protein